MATLRSDSEEELGDEFGDEAVANLVEAVQELLPRMSQACLERAKERILALGEEVTDAACAEQDVQDIITAAASGCPDVDEAGAAAFAEWAGNLDAPALDKSVRELCDIIMQGRPGDELLAFQLTLARGFICSATTKWGNGETVDLGGNYALGMKYIIHRHLRVTVLKVL